MICLSRPTSRRLRRSTGRRGFTLVEAVLAMAIALIVLGTLESLILVAGKSVPSEKSPATASLRASAGLDELAADLGRATSFLELTSRTAEMALPDLDGDGDADQVRYEWSGIAGAPLYRSYTGSDTVPYDTTPAVVVPAVASLSFVPDVRTVLSTTGGLSIGGSSQFTETLLNRYESTSSLGAQNITSNNSIGQVFIPSIPTSATSYRVTRLALLLQSSKAIDGTVTVAIRNASTAGTAPGSTVLASQTVREASLTKTMNWVTLSFPDCPDLDPTKRYSFTVTWVAGSRACRVQTQTTGTTATTLLSRSSNGNTWSTSAGSSVIYRVYGLVTLPPGTTSTTPISVLTSSVVQGVTVRVTPSAVGANAIESYHSTLNLPESP